MAGCSSLRPLRGRFASFAGGGEIGGEIPNPISRTANVETVEAAFLICYLFCRRMRDSSGPGRWRGCTGGEFAITPHRAPDSPFSAAPQAPLLVRADARDGAGGKERRWSNPMTARQSRALGGHLWDSRRVRCCCVALRFLRRNQSRIGVDVGRNQFVLFHAQHRAAYGTVGKNQPTSNVMLIAESEFSPV